MKRFTRWFSNNKFMIGLSSLGLGIIAIAVFTSFSANDKMKWEHKRQRLILYRTWIKANPKYKTLTQDEFMRLYHADILPNTTKH